MLFLIIIIKKSINLLLLLIYFIIKSFLLIKKFKNVFLFKAILRIFFIKIKIKIIIIIMRKNNNNNFKKKYIYNHDYWEAIVICWEIVFLKKFHVKVLLILYRMQLTRYCDYEFIIEWI